MNKFHQTLRVSISTAWLGVRAKSTYLLHPGSAFSTSEINSFQNVPTIIIGFSAQKAGRALVRIQPNFAWAWIYKGESSQAFGHLSDALDEYDKSIQLEENSHAWTKIGEVKEEFGDYVASQKAYDRASLVAQEEADDFFRHEY